MDIKNLLCAHVNADAKKLMISNPDTYFYSSYDSPSSSSLSSSPSSTYGSPFSVLVPPLSSPLMKEISHSQLSQSRIQPRSTTHTRTPWTSDEDYLLQKGYRQGLSWAMISSTFLPHRSRGCCWGRFKTLQAKALERRDWSDPEDRLLLLAAKKHAKLFKHAWKSVAQDLDQHRGWRECESRFLKLGGIMRKKHLQPHINGGSSSA